MLNPHAKLNPEIFSKDVKTETNRAGFGEGLVLAGRENEKVVALSADLSESTFTDLFKKEFPERFVEVGVAEQNMITIASGIASSGKIPFATSYAVFSPGRNWEQIRTTICYNDVPVKIIGSHTGLSAGRDGGSHQALEDIAMMRTLPNMTVISPCDAIEAKKATIAMAKINKPVYMRLHREKTPIITTEETDFQIGKSEIFFQPIIGKADVGIIATGPIIYEAMLVAKELENMKIGVTVLNVHTIKPLDEEAIRGLAKETHAIVVVEEHQIAGGLGSAVAEYLSKHFPVPMEFVGVNDKFGQSGSYKELLEHYKMLAPNIMEAVKKVMERKK